MKQILSTLFIFFFQFLNAQSDRQDIVRVIQNYQNGDTNKNYKILAESFHSNAMMKYVSSKYGYKEYNALKIFESYIGKAPEENRKNKIVSISITGKAASVIVEAQYPKKVVVDYISLLKIDDTWKIVSKVFSKKGEEQLDDVLIKKTLQNYINGSSYNSPQLLKSAFTADATLYLTGKKGFNRYTPEEYSNFFKNKEKGAFNGRKGEIIQVERTKDIATAKVKISNPQYGWVYVDLFLLKKIENNWKIISKTATKTEG